MDVLENEEGLEGFSESTMIALIDADTIAYAAAITNEYADDILSEEMYSKQEWEAIINDPNYDSIECCIWKCNLENAVADAVNRINDILLATDCYKAELYFTTGLNFRHTVDPLYKANRKATRYPSGNRAVKDELHKLYEGEICEGYEADDIVVALKDLHPDKYVLCAVDKDVYKSVAGRHYNYYYSERHKISPKWVTISFDEAMKFHPLQTLCGDPTDNIKGCPSIGPKKAEKALANCRTLFEMWVVVEKLFIDKGISRERMIKDARLTGMHQLEQCDEGKWCWRPFVIPTDG
jgi:DNA polymerase-1